MNVFDVPRIMRETFLEIILQEVIHFQQVLADLQIQQERDHIALQQPVEQEEEEEINEFDDPRLDIMDTWLDETWFESCRKKADWPYFGIQYCHREIKKKRMNIFLFFGGSFILLFEEGKEAI